MSNKSKNLSVADYFEVVQREYLISEFRRKIYFCVKDKQYYQKVSAYKVEKIETIAKRNSLNSILNNQETYNAVYSELFFDNGKPKFELNEIDLFNYYTKNCEFSYAGNVVILEDISQDTKDCLIFSKKCPSEKNTVKCEDLVRIV